MAFLIPEPGWITFILSASLCILLAIFVYVRRILDLKASLISSLLGFVIIIYSDFFWFLLILSFLTVSYLATMWKYSVKNQSGFSEGAVGERNVKNVVANGIAPLAVVVLSGPLNEMADGLAGFMFMITIAIATSDTFASEIGIMAKRPRLITNPSVIVEPGKDGGVSLLGNVAALLGALLIAVLGFFLVTDRLTDLGPHTLEASGIIVVAVVILGWLGCQLDSFLGATLQNRGYISNNMVNFLTITAGALISIPIFILLL